MARSIKKTGLVQIQSDTIEVMQRQIDALKEQNQQQQKKLDQQDYRLDQITEALKDEYNIFITVDGEKVTIKDARGPEVKHIIRKPTRKTQSTTSSSTKKEEM